MDIFFSMENKIEETDLSFTGPHKVKLEKWISCAPFEKLLGINIIEARDGHAHLTMPFVFKLAQGKGMLHGGATVALADTSISSLWCLSQHIKTLYISFLPCSHNISFAFLEEALSSQ